MVETAVAVNSIPPDWYTDDRLLLTILDVLAVAAERAKRKGRK
jgi:hypothetical protein